MSERRANGDSVLAYHFVGDTLRDGRPVPPDGEWLVHDGPVVICESGLHASEHPRDALRYAPGPWLCRVELRGVVDRQNDKLVARERRILQRIDATNLLRQFARQCASDVLHLWDAPDVVRQYLATGDGRIAAAASAAAWDAAWDAARAASTLADDAAWVAARAASAIASDTAWVVARTASWDAAEAVARTAAVAAARDAARDAALAAQRERFAALVDTAFATQEAP